MNKFEIIWVDTEGLTHTVVIQSNKASFACIEVEQRPECILVLDCALIMA